MFILSQKSKFSLRRLSTMALKDSYHSRGYEYEQKVREVLDRNFNMLTELSGGAHDGGVDLRGYWLPSNNVDFYSKIRIIVQCKCKEEEKIIGPSVIRELEGTLLTEPADSIGMLATNVELSSAALKRLKQSPKPLFYFQYFGNELNSDEKLILNDVLKMRFPRLSVSMTRGGRFPKPILVWN